MPLDPKIQRLPGETDAAFRMRQYGMDPNNPQVDEDYTPIEPESQKEYIGGIGNVDRYDEDMGFGKKLWSSFKKNPLPYLQGVGYGADALISYNNEVSQDMDYENGIRNRTQQDPIYDYNNMYGKDTNGGSQFQPIVKAEDGALVRGPSSKALPIEIEGGELLQLPDGKLEIGKGPKHKKGGIPTLLPSGTRVFSNKLKPKDSDKTFAELAKLEDYTEEQDTLNNFYALAPSKQAAELMMQRKMKNLEEIFQSQQMMNDDSSGESSFKKGGKMSYENGGEYDMDEKEIARLKKLGYKIETI